MHSSVTEYYRKFVVSYRVIAKWMSVLEGWRQYSKHKVGASWLPTAANEAHVVWVGHVIGVIERTDAAGDVRYLTQVWTLICSVAADYMVCKRTALRNIFCLFWNGIAINFRMAFVLGVKGAQVTSSWWKLYIEYLHTSYC
jgi:hypothetical protein